MKLEQDAVLQFTPDVSGTYVVHLTYTVGKGDQPPEPETIDEGRPSTMADLRVGAPPLPFWMTWDVRLAGEESARC